MAAPKGNSFWKLATSKPGRKRVFASPAALRDTALEYFKSVDDNPLYEEKVFCHAGEITTYDVAKKRPYTISGMCVFMRITEDTWANYRIREEFLGVVKIIEGIIRTQKFDGATSGFFNPLIIARDLGLKDKQEINNTHVLSDIQDPVEEMKRRGIPIPDIDIEDIE